MPVATWYTATLHNPTVYIFVLTTIAHLNIAVRMTLASNLLQLIFSLLVGVASLLGALFIIGFLLVEPRNEFDDDDHDNDSAVPRKTFCHAIV